MKYDLQIWRDGCATVEPLRPGDAGTLQTLEHMARIVREDAKKADLRRFVAQRVFQGVRGHDHKGEIDAAFNFAQHGITYREDPAGVERVSDLWTTLHGLEGEETYAPEGDCGLKTEALCTALALFGHQPYFTLIQQDPNAPTFDHIFCHVFFERRWLALDPTPEEIPGTALHGYGVGWHPTKYVRIAHYEIFR